VLTGYCGQPGASSRPPLAAQASHHGGTSPIPGQRETTATAAPATAATASANPDGASAGGTGSTPTSTSSLVKKTRTSPALEPNRRSQPRTVSTGRPHAAAIGRAPAPAAFAASAAPITSARSARLSSANTGRSTCVTPHLPQRARRGRTVTSPQPPRSTRGRAHPHPASTPPQPGHSSSPPASRTSTATASAPTVSTSASERYTALPGALGQETPGGPTHAPIGKVPPPANSHAPGTSSQHHRRTQCRKSAAPVGTQSAAQHPVGASFGAACHQLDRADLMLAGTRDRTRHGTSRRSPQAEQGTDGPGITALARHDPASQTVTLVLDAATANIAIYAITACAQEREAHLREVQLYSQELPEGSYGRRNRQAITDRETRITTRLRAIEHAYQTAIEHHAEPSTPEPAVPLRPPERAVDGEHDLEIGQ
jgi:hypothetical protein